MGIFDRMGRVISSNLNALFDKAEDAEKLLTLNLSEMENEIRAAKQDVISASAQLKVNEKKMVDLEAEVDLWQKRAEMALEHSNEVLAREALVQKKKLSEKWATAKSAAQNQVQVALTMRQELTRMETKLEELKMKKSSLVAEMNQAKTADGGLASASGLASPAMAKFKALEQSIEQKVSEGQAMKEVEASLYGVGGVSAKDLEAQFRELEYKVSRGQNKGSGSGEALSQDGVPGADLSEIDMELLALKKKIRV